MYNSLMNEELDAAVDDYRFFKASLEVTLILQSSRVLIMIATRI